MQKSYLAVYNNEFILGSACIGSENPRSRGKTQWDVLLRRLFETDAGSWHSCNVAYVYLYLEASSSFFNRTVPCHIAPERHRRYWIRRRPILTHPISGRLTHRTLTRLTIHLLEFASGASLWYQDLRRRRTETTHQQLVGRSESQGYWMCCRRVASASTRLHSCRRRTFWAHAVMKMTWHV